MASKAPLLTLSITGAIGLVSTAALTSGKLFGPAPISTMDPLQEEDWEKILPRNNPQNPHFLLGTYRCSATFFPGTPRPVGQEVVETEADEESKNNNNEALKVSPSSQTQPPKDSQIQACSLMDYQRSGYKFLLRSELAVRTENIGIALWVGMKSNELNKDDGRIFVTYHMTFYEKDSNETWHLKTGYSWRTETKASNANRTLRIEYPIHETIKFGSNERSSNRNITFSGTWEESTDRTGFPIFISSPKWELSDIPSFYPINAKGYQEVDTFYHEPQNNSRDWKWKKIKTISLAPKETIENWLLYFRENGDAKKLPKKGRWISFDEYCGRSVRANQELLNGFCIKESN